MNRRKTSSRAVGVRMNVKLSTDEFPVLAAEMERLPKGSRRTCRLAHLATLGLLWERSLGGVAAVQIVCSSASSEAPAPASVTDSYRGRLDVQQLEALFEGIDQ